MGDNGSLLRAYRCVCSREAWRETCPGGREGGAQVDVNHYSRSGDTALPRINVCQPRMLVEAMWRCDAAEAYGGTGTQGCMARCAFSSCKYVVGLQETGRSPGSLVVPKKPTIKSGWSRGIWPRRNRKSETEALGYVLMLHMATEEVILISRSSV